MTASPSRSASKAAYLNTSGRSICRRRRGSSYVFFIGTAMVVMIIGLSALMAVRIQRRGAEGSNDLATARFYAQSAIEYGFTVFNQDADWRTNLGSGFWLTDLVIYGGTFSLEATFVDDGDGKPANDDVVLTGTGVNGPATHKMQVTLIAQTGGIALSPGSWKRSLN